MTMRSDGKGRTRVDIHCHMLPGIDDGPRHIDMALEMARLAVADGIAAVVCTPHIYPGVYANSTATIAAALTAFRQRLQQEGISLDLGIGADLHADINVVPRLREGTAPSINGGRYVLLELPHRVARPIAETILFQLQQAGYVPIVTHPERQAWIEDLFADLPRWVASGVLIQVTAQAVIGKFGKRPQHWARRLLDAGLVHLLASDAHNTTHRPPCLSPSYDYVVKRLGVAEADNLVIHRPRAVFENVPITHLPDLPDLRERDRPPGRWPRAYRPLQIGQPKRWFFHRF